MANPTQEHEDLLRRHRFALVSENKHRKYKDPEGRVYIVSKTPSDWWAWRNALTTLKRVIASSVPTSEVIEEERQRRELEATITLQAQPKPSIAGVAGAGKGKKSNGIGIYYEQKLPSTAEELALQEKLRRRANANKERKEAEKGERRALRRANEEWARRLSQFRRSVRQVERDVSEASSLARTAVLLALSRFMAAQMLREWRVEKPEEVKPPDVRRRMLDGIVLLNWRKVATGDDKELFAELVGRAEALYDHCGQFLMYSGGRVPRFYPPIDESVTLTARQLTMLRRAVAYLEDGRKLELNERGGVRLVPPPGWLSDAVMRLRVGENKYQPEPDCLSEASIGADLPSADESTSSTERELVGR